MFAYHMIQNNGRVPIIIELRGRSPGILTQQELLFSLADKYDINVHALLQLIIAGRILLIFEGFDEMAYASVYEERI